ncbi:MAG: family 20 glycosylhydrolase [Bacteroidales bacterium]|nr:family 20 glycosylhydrolase [Bacteroidales bacterium]
MKKIILILVIFSFACNAQTVDSLFKIKGFCIAAPQPEELNRFISFMENELALNGFNTLVLRVDYNYQYESYPNLSNQNALSKDEVKLLITSAKKNNINVIPQINLLGHQSWAGSMGNLLKEYPEFDETPSVKLPEVYKWPNNEGLYCKSYCPLHPGVHEIIFALVDEIMGVYEATAFHAGMDEVFYIGMDECPRCNNKDKAELFAGEVKKIHDHLAKNNQELWIWGDRLLDGESTGLGIWEASANNTFHAIDKIPKDVVICDWHYDKAEATAPCFTIKGFKVITCPWNKADVTRAQLEMTEFFLLNSNPVLSEKYLGVMQTIWSSVTDFLDLYYSAEGDNELSGPVNSFKEMISYFKE